MRALLTHAQRAKRRPLLPPPAHTGWPALTTGTRSRPSSMWPARGARGPTCQPNIATTQGSTGGCTAGQTRGADPAGPLPSWMPRVSTGRRRRWMAALPLPKGGGRRRADWDGETPPADAGYRRGQGPLGGSRSAPTSGRCAGRGDAGPHTLPSAPRVPSDLARPGHRYPHRRLPAPAPPPAVPRQPPVHPAAASPRRLDAGPRPAPRAFREE